MTQLKITDDLQALLDVLPMDIRSAVEQADDSENLLEIILDLGRVPTARFVDREISLRIPRSRGRRSITWMSAPANSTPTTAPALNARCTASRPSETGVRILWV